MECVMALPELSLGAWVSVLIGLALELGCVAGVLLFASYLVGRRWSERLLVIVPVAAFVWMLPMARGVQAQHDYWTSYLAFQVAHYPPSAYPELARQTQQEYADVLQRVSRLGWIAVLVTEGCVLLGGALALRWSRHPRLASQGRRAATHADVEAGESDITVEPLNHHNTH
jgi:hypothetical protein